MDRNGEYSYKAGEGHEVDDYTGEKKSMNKVMKNVHTVDRGINGTERKQSNSEERAFMKVKKK